MYLTHSTADQLVSLRPVGILNPIKFDLGYLFHAFARAY